jgi:hypothetical protein
MIRVARRLRRNGSDFGFNMIPEMVIARLTKIFHSVNDLSGARCSAVI